MENRRNEVVDICRGLSAVLMILGHSFITYPVNVANVTWCSALEHFIYSFHMEMFFFLAGVVYKCKDYINFMKNKVFRILIPYFFFGLLTLFFKAYGGDAVNGVEPVGKGIKNMLLYGGNYWFLYVLFVIFAIYPVFERLGSNKKSVLILLSIVCMFARFLVPTMCPLRLDYFVKFFPYFAIGNMMHDLVQNSWRPTHHIPIYLCCIAVYVLSDIVMTVYSIGKPLDYVRAFSIILLMIWVTTDVVAKGTTRNGIFKSVRSFLISCSQFSLQLYLFNGFLLTAIRIVICKLAGIHNSILIVASIWIGNLVITLLLCEYIIPNIPVVRTLCGMNKKKERTTGGEQS